MPKKKVTPKISPYTVRMIVGDVIHNSQGTTIMEAFNKMELGKLVLTGKVFITIAHGEKKHEFFLPPIQARKLCQSKSFQQIFEKRSLLFLGEKTL